MPLGAVEADNAADRLGLCQKLGGYVLRGDTIAHIGAVSGLGWPMMDI